MGLDIFGGKWKSLAAKEQLREEIGNLTDLVFAPVESFPGIPAYTPTSSAASGRRMPGNSKKTGKSKKRIRRHAASVFSCQGAVFTDRTASKQIRKKCDILRPQGQLPRLFL